MHVCSPVLVGVETANLADMVSFRLTLSQKTKWRVPEEDTWHIRKVGVYTHTSPPTTHGHRHAERENISPGLLLSFMPLDLSLFHMPKTSSHLCSPPKAQLQFSFFKLWLFYSTPHPNTFSRLPSMLYLLIALFYRGLIVWDSCSQEVCFRYVVAVCRHSLCTL